MNLILTLVLWTFMGCPDAEAERKAHKPVVAQMEIGEVVIIRGTP